MGCVTHVEDKNKDLLVCNVHKFSQLGVKVVDLHQGWLHGP